MASVTVCVALAVPFGFAGCGGTDEASLNKPGDYDCAGGSGDGPNYVDGPVEITGGDRHGLDADGDGVGCE